MNWHAVQVEELLRVSDSDVDALVGTVQSGGQRSDRTVVSVVGDEISQSLKEKVEVYLWSISSIKAVQALTSVEVMDFMSWNSIIIVVNTEHLLVFVVNFL